MYCYFDMGNGNLALGNGCTVKYCTVRRHNTIHAHETIMSTLIHGLLELCRHMYARTYAHIETRHERGILTICQNLDVVCAPSVV